MIALTIQQCHELAFEHNELQFELAPENQFKLALLYDAGSNMFIGNKDEAYTAEIVAVKITAYKRMKAGYKPKFACKPDPYAGFWR